MSTKDRIRAAQDIQHEVVVVPEWDDVKIEIRTMTLAQRAAYGLRVTQIQAELGLEEGTDVPVTATVPELLVASCYDPDTGERLFEPADIEWLREKAGGPLETLAMTALKVSGMDAKAVDRLGKDSSSTPSGDGASASPPTSA